MDTSLIKKIEDSRPLNVALWTVALLVTVFGFWFVRFGFDVNDEAYQTMNAMDPHINPQAILSSAISGLVGRVFGFGFLTMRTLTFLITVIAIGSASFFHYRRTTSGNISLFLYVSLLSAALCCPVKSRLIGWDCYAVLFCTLSLIFICRLWNSAKIFDAAVLGFITACATLCRFPDIVIVPFACLALWLVNKSASPRRMLAMTGAFAGMFVLAVVVLLSVIYTGGVAEWFEGLRSSFVSGHGISRLVTNYIHTGSLDMFDLVLLSSFLFFVSKIAKGKKFIMFLGMLFMALCVLGVLILKIDRVFYPVLRLLTSCVIILTACYIASGRDWKNVLQAVVVIGCCVAPMAGSDGGTVKFMNIPSLPVVLALLAGVNSGFTDLARKATYVILFVITAIMPFYTAAHTVFDGGWRNATSSVGHPLLHNNFTTAQRAAEINDMLAEGRGLIPANSLILGSDNRRFFSEYLFGSRNRLWPHSWSDDIFNDSDKVEALRRFVETDNPECIVMTKYGTMHDSLYWEHNAMRTVIEDTDRYETSEYDWFVIFRRKSD